MYLYLAKKGRPIKRESIFAQFTIRIKQPLAEKLEIMAKEGGVPSVNKYIKAVLEEIIYYEFPELWADAKKKYKPDWPSLDKHPDR